MLLDENISDDDIFINCQFLVLRSIQVDDELQNLTYFQFCHGIMFTAVYVDLPPHNFNSLS